MLHISIPDDAYLTGKNDKGKKVTVNSMGGAFVDKPGVVVIGPYVYPYVHKTEIKTKSRNPMAQRRYKSEDRVSAPLWLVEVDEKLFSFAATELKFQKR